MLYVLNYNKEQNLNFSEKQYSDILEKTHFNNKQIDSIFQNIKDNSSIQRNFIEKTFLKIIQEPKSILQTISYIIDPKIQNKLPSITTKILTTILDNIQQLNLETKKNMGKEFHNFISEMNRLYPDVINHVINQLYDNHKNMISSLTVLSTKPNFVFIENKNTIKDSDVKKYFK